MPRGSKPGERRGGRKVGTPNKRTLELHAVLADNDFDPVQILIHIAQNPKTEVVLKARICSDFLDYVFPKRKALEVAATITEGSTLAELLAAYNPLRK